MYIDLESNAIKEYDFLHIFNALYNLLIDKTNPKREKYIIKNSEEILSQLNKKEYLDDLEHIHFRIMELKTSLKIEDENIWDADVRQLFQHYNSDKMSGYALRCAEELYTGKKSKKLKSEEIEKIVNRKKISNTELKGMNLSETERKIYIFCKSLRDSEIFLLPSKEIIETMNVIIAQFAEDTYKTTLETLKKIYPGVYEVIKDKNWEKDFGIPTSKEEILNIALNDFIFGYRLKASESLL